MIKVSEVENRVDWNKAVRNLPGHSILQTWEWGQVKSAFGWDPRYFVWRNSSNLIVSAALILVREIRMPVLSTKIKTVYIPQGPLMDWKNHECRDQVLNDIGKFAGSIGAFFIKIRLEKDVCKNCKNEF